MKTRSDSQKIVSKRKITDKVVSATIAKRDWFLKSSDLAKLPHAGGGAAWGVGRFATKYTTPDLDRLALRIHGVVGLAKKRAARSRRLENNVAKTQVKRRRSRFWDDEDNVEEVEEVEEVKFSEKHCSRSAKRRKWISNNVTSVMEDVQDSDEEFVLGKRQSRRKKPKNKIAKGKNGVEKGEEVVVDDSYFG
jgi:hypothetical protein